MLLQLDEWHLGYKQILHDCENSENGSANVMILSSTDTDAVCATRIITYMFRADNICYQLRPCDSFPVFQSIINKLENNFVALILINIGAMRNLSRLNVGENTKIYVLDCHRPFHLGNIHAGDSVIVFLEGFREGEDVPSDGDDLSGKDDSSDEEDDSDDSDSEEEFGFDEDNESQTSQPVSISPEKKRRRIQKRHKEDGSVVEDDTDSVKDNSGSLTNSSLKELRRTRRRRIALYYSSSFHSVPASWSAYMLSQQLRFTNMSDLLWLACIGLTDALLHNRLTLIGYNHLAKSLSVNVRRLFPQDLLSKSLKAFHASDNTPITISEHGAILCEPDFHFFLLRHSSLYESMTHTFDLALNFQIWKRDGVDMFRDLLAKMGYSLKESRQPYALMHPNLRRRLKDALLQHAPEYGLEKKNLFYLGFIRITGYQSFISAADVAYSVSALLELPIGTDTEDDVALSEEQRSFKYFNRAFDALNSKSFMNTGNKLQINGSFSSTSATPSLGTGIQLAMKLQNLILSTAVNLDEKNAIVRLLHFRYVYLRLGFDTPSEQYEIATSKPNTTTAMNVFSKPLALTRLAHFILEMKSQQISKKNINLPLILLAEKPNAGTYLIVGYTFSSSNEEDVIRNRFDSLFELAAMSLSSSDHPVKFETFLGNAVEVDKKYVQRFMEQLHFFMDTE